MMLVFIVTLVLYFYGAFAVAQEYERRSAFWLTLGKWSADKASVRSSSSARLLPW